MNSSTLFEIQKVKGNGERVTVRRFGRLTSAYSYIDTTARRIQRKFKRQQVGLAEITYVVTDDDGCHATIDLRLKAHNFSTKHIHRHYVIKEVNI